MEKWEKKKLVLWIVERDEDGLDEKLEIVAIDTEKIEGY